MGWEKEREKEENSEGGAKTDVLLLQIVFTCA